jgi:hypothetical protein
MNKQSADFATIGPKNAIFGPQMMFIAENIVVWWNIIYGTILWTKYTISENLKIIM